MGISMLYFLHYVLNAIDERCFLENKPMQGMFLTKHKRSACHMLLEYLLLSVMLHVYYKIS